MPRSVDPLYEAFVKARSQAMALTDEYARLVLDHPGQRELWQQVVAQTELAHDLLKRWLADRHTD